MFEQHDAVTTCPSVNSAFAPASLHDWHVVKLLIEQKLPMQQSAFPGEHEPLFLHEPLHSLLFAHALLQQSAAVAHEPPFGFFVHTAAASAASTAESMTAASLPLVPLVPEVPSVPLAVLVPEVPLVPDVPLLPPGSFWSSVLDVESARFAIDAQPTTSVMLETTSRASHPMFED
ncbi:MAG: hypothetical protein JWP87_4870 [Labilithrix sp.]|nr:hypothetical protein [Labilithrix sp.]